MKKTLTIILALCGLIPSLQAAPVSQSRARQIASDFFGVDFSAPRLALGSRASVSVKGVSDPAYYIFNNDGGGFVIVSGDDLLDPILGYSRTGHIDADRIPENMLFWLDQVRESVRILRKHNVPSSVRESLLRKRPATRADEGSGKFLELPEWSQENPYNWFCPTIAPYESEKSMTGCVATAISMVMRYHEWPPCGNGNLPDYAMDFYPDPNSYKTIKVNMKGHALGHEYKWSIMPMQDFYSETPVIPTEGQKQVAWLMYDCGIMMQASYSSEGTGAFSQDIPEAITRYMYYKSSAQYVTKSRYSDEEWIALLKDQIDRDLPVIYGADCELGGHQFLVHGYDADDNVYVNWGWGGEFNGYFAIDYFYPYKDVDWTEYGYTQQEAREIEQEETYNSNHDAIINVEPDRSVTPVPVAMDEPEPIVTEVDLIQLYLKAGKSGKYTYEGITVTSGSFKQGGSFQMKAGLIHNPSSIRFDGSFRFVQTDWQGNVIGPLSVKDKTAYVRANNSYYVYDVDCVASYDWNLGDKIRFFCSQSGSDFYLVGWDDDGQTIGEIPLIPMYFIDPDEEETLINSNEKYSSVAWSADATKEKAVITYPDGSTETIVRRLSQ